MAFCENCGARLTPGVAFCENCGVKQSSRSEKGGSGHTEFIAEHHFCEECGMKLNPGDSFCENCGTSIASLGMSFPQNTQKGIFDDNPNERFDLFNLFTWAIKWEDVAKKVSGEKELGIILTNLSVLASQLGVTEARVREVILKYITTAKRRGVEYYVLRLEKNSVCFGSDTPRDVEDIVALLRKVVDVARPKYLFILGNESIVDVINWDNEGHGDPDVDSDFVYSVLDTTSPWEGQDFNLTEALRVGRLPSSDGDFDGFENYFLVAAEGIGSVEDIHSFGLSAQVWEEESQFEFEHFRHNSRDVETSPDAGVEESREMLVYDGKDYNLLFFNLHGSDQAKYWYGQRGFDYPEAVSPDIFCDYAVPFFLGVEACYGARYIGYTTEESILKTALRNKCLAFLGSSRIAMGASEPEFRSCADIVIGDFLKHVACGETAGDAHILSLKALIRKSVSEQDCLDADDVMTIVEFSLYGDPSACIGKNKNTGKIKGLFKKAVGGVPKGIRIPMPDVDRASKMYLAEVNAEIEAKIDAYAAKYLPISRGDEIYMKGLGFSHKTYQLQNGKLYNKTYSFNSKLGKSRVSVYFDKDGNIRKTTFSK